MRKVVENALRDVMKSKFIFKENREIEVRDAVIIWTNFRGEANKFGNAARTFNLVITAEVAEILTKAGWRVREVPDEENPEIILYLVNIKVNMESNYPPIITLFSKFRGKRSRRTLDISTVGELDRVDIQSADCVINPYESPNFPGKVTGYLKKLNVIQEPDIEFGGKYDDWLEEPNEFDSAGNFDEGE